MRTPLAILLSLLFSSLLLAPALALAEPPVPAIESKDPLAEDAATHWAKVKLNEVMLVPGGEITTRNGDPITSPSWYPVVQTDDKHLQLVIEANKIRTVVWTGLDQVSVANTGPVAIAEKKSKASATPLGNNTGIELRSRRFLDEMPEEPVPIDVLGDRGWIGVSAFGYVFDSKEIPGNEEDPGTWVEWKSDRMVIRSSPESQANIVAEISEDTSGTKLVFLLEEGDGFHKVQVDVLAEPSLKIVGWVEDDVIGSPEKGGVAGNVPLGIGGLGTWGTNGPTASLDKGHEVFVEPDGKAFARVTEDGASVALRGEEKDGWHKVSFPIGSVWLEGWTRLPDEKE